MLLTLLLFTPVDRFGLLVSIAQVTLFGLMPFAFTAWMMYQGLLQLRQPRATYRQQALFMLIATPLLWVSYCYFLMGRLM